MSNLKYLEESFSIDAQGSLSNPITLNETKYALQKLKDGKATGCDEIKNEIIKSPKLTKVVHNLFVKCFETGLVPTKWRTGIISPIPTNNMKSQTDPLNYCGLMLLCTLEKAFTSILNCRLVNHLEDYNLICEEQAGFRPGYSCLDQAFALNTIIKIRLQFGIPTYCAFVDLQKYFDWIDCKLLCYKLLCCEINGKFYRVLHSIYKETSASVKLNTHITDSFKINSGVMQGETLSPTHASLYLNEFYGFIKKCSIWY